MLYVYLILIIAGIVLSAKGHMKDKTNASDTYDKASFAISAFAGLILGIWFMLLPGNSRGNVFFQNTFFLIMAFGISAAITHWVGLLAANLLGRNTHNSSVGTNNSKKPERQGTNNKALRTLQLIGSIYLLIGAVSMLFMFPGGMRTVSLRNGNVIGYAVLMMAFTALLTFFGVKGILSYKNWKTSQPVKNLQKPSVQPVDNALVQAVKKGLYNELGAGDLYAIKESQNASNADSLRAIHDFRELADEYAHMENLFADNPKKKELEKQLLAGGNEAITAIREYLICCGTGQVSYGWWNGAAGLTRMFRKIAGNNAKKDLNRLKNLSSNIWEYQTQVKETAEKELLVIAKENGGYDSSHIPAEYAHAELLNLQNISSPEKRLEQFFAMQKSINDWSDADKAFYYFIAGGAAKALYPNNKSHLAFYAAQVSCNPVPTSMGWNHLREAEGNNIPDTPTPESIQRMCEKYPLPKNLQDTKDYVCSRNDNVNDEGFTDNVYTLDQGLKDLTDLFRSYPAVDTAKIQSVGKKIYDAKIPLVSGVGGMHQLYMRFKQQMPMYASELSRIWDGIGDWAD